MNIATAQRAAPKPKSVSMPSEKTMSADELSKAIDACGTVYIGVPFTTSGAVSFLRWKDRSFAIRRKIRD